MLRLSAVGQGLLTPELTERSEGVKSLPAGSSEANWGAIVVLFTTLWDVPCR
jgi:hypothetical protein